MTYERKMCVQNKSETSLHRLEGSANPCPGAPPQAATGLLPLSSAATRERTVCSTSAVSRRTRTRPACVAFANSVNGSSQGISARRKDESCPAARSWYRPDAARLGCPEPAECPRGRPCHVPGPRDVPEEPVLPRTPAAP